MKRSLWKLLPALPLIAGCGGHWTRSAAAPTPPPGGSCGALPLPAPAGTVFYLSKYGSAVGGLGGVYAEYSNATCRTQIRPPLNGRTGLLAISPDGRRLVNGFVGGGCGSTRVTIEDINGVVVGTFANGQCDFPLVRYRPDGNRIVFSGSVRTVSVSGGVSLVKGVATVDSSGGDQKILVEAPSASETFSQPVYSRDGAKIAFTESTFSDKTVDGVYLMNEDGTGKTHPVTERVTQVEFSASGLLYRTGSPLDFTSFTGTLVASAVDGSGAKQLADRVGAFAVSPDGTFAVFETDRDGDGELYRINIDGTNLKRLTASPGTDSEPSISADGTRVAFVSERDGNKEIYVMNVDGSGTIRLTQNLSDEESPVIR